MITLAAGILVGIVTVLPPGPGPGERLARTALGQCYRAAAESCAPVDTGCLDAGIAVCQQMLGDLDAARTREGANLRRRVLRTSLGGAAR